MEIMEQFIEDLYNNTREALLKDVPDEEIEKLSAGYREHLKAVYEGLAIVDGKYKKALESETNEYLRKLESLASISRLALYVRDENMSELCRLAGEALELAIHRDENAGKLDEKEIEGRMKRMQELYDEVEWFNKLAAKTALSEGTIEYRYALGKTDMMSMRLSHYVRK